MSKLSDAQIKVLESVHATGELPKGTRQATITKLREELGFLLVTRIGEETNYTLTTEGRKAIGVAEDGDFTPENIARAIEEIELDEEPVQWDEHLDQEQTEEPAVPYFNRKALRDLRRDQSRFNRRKMREQGRRRRKYGADDPKYFARKVYGLAA